MAVEAQRPESKLWSKISDLVTEEGLLLFDIDEPQGGSVLRVFITANRDELKSNQRVSACASLEDDALGEAGVTRSGVGFDDCTRVCRRLLDVDEVDAFIPDGCLLEVSSPGVNRRLRFVEHLEGAVGERIKMKFRAANGTTRTVVGVLTGVESGSVSVNVEDNNEVVKCAVTDIRDARVDFLFEDRKKNKSK